MRGKQPDIDIVWHNFPLTAPLWPSITKTADSSSSPSVQPPCDTQTFFQFKIWYWWSTASCCSHFEPCWGQYPYPYARCGHNSRHTVSTQGSGRQFSKGRLLWLKKEKAREVTFLFFAWLCFKLAAHALSNLTHTKGLPYYCHQSGLSEFTVHQKSYQLFFFVFLFFFFKFRIARINVGNAHLFKSQTCLNCVPLCFNFMFLYILILNFML